MEILKQFKLKFIAVLENNQLLISMSNPFDPLSNASTKGTGYGLLSIEKKMQIL